MIYTSSIMAISIFSFFIIIVIGLSSFLARRAKSSSGYYAAGGTIHWSVNGIAFAGDYLSAASFLGICGLIATVGYDGFLYSIGYLAGWIVALFVVAEPLKRLGKYTFTDALDSKFNSQGIKLAASLSTLIVSLCYLIPQMVGAGALVTPLLGLAHYWGVIIVGGIVIFIVATAGMTSTTYVQFLKGILLIIFSTILTIYVLNKGLNVNPSEKYHKFQSLNVKMENDVISVEDGSYKVIDEYKEKDNRFIKLEKDGISRWWMLKNDESKNSYFLEECLSIVIPKSGGDKLYNGKPKESAAFFPAGHLKKVVVDGKETESTGPLGPVKFLSSITESQVVRYVEKTFKTQSESVKLWYPAITHGKKIMRPGVKLKIDKNSPLMSKLNFISLMLALFLGTAALPHILIRYYTVPSQKCARKSTIVAIIAIGFFYILTIYMGLGAMINGVIDVENSNMSAPLLAKFFGAPLFAIISAIAFATVLGTVSGLIIAASGAVAHDLMDKFFNITMTDRTKVKAGKISAVVVGIIAIILGIIFENMNVSFLVGLAFAVAASANLPSILMLLFWKKTTAYGITVSIAVGIISSLAVISVSPSLYGLYGLDPAQALIQLDNPGIISIPLSFISLIKLDEKN